LGSFEYILFLSAPVDGRSAANSIGVSNAKALFLLLRAAEAPAPRRPEGAPGKKGGTVALWGAICIRGVAEYLQNIEGAR